MSSVLRTVLAATSLGAAAAFGLAGSATAAPVTPDGLSRADDAGSLGASELSGAVAAYEAVFGVIGQAQLNPMNGGGLNPLSNTVGADMGEQQVGTGLVTGDLADGMTVREVLDGV